MVYSEHIVDTIFLLCPSVNLIYLYRSKFRKTKHFLNSFSRGYIFCCDSDDNKHFIIIYPLNDRLPNGDINMLAFDKLATIVGAFTKHMTEVSTDSEYADGCEELYRYMQTCTLLNDAGNI